MKSMKKLVLVALVLLASVIVLVGCDTNAGDTPSSTGGTTQQPGSEGTGGTTQQPGSEGTGGESANNALTLTISDASGSSMSVTLQDENSDGFYEIGTANELYAFAAAVHVKGLPPINGKLTSNIVVNETVLDEQGKLSENVNFRPWTPIGNGDTPYTGIFDGAEYTISGLYFNDTNADYAGLFGFLGEGGSVQNLGVENSYFCGGICVGGVVGDNSGQVTNCDNTGAVSGTATSCYVGGIVGYNYQDSTVTNCHNTGDVTGEGTYCFVGGVVGDNYGDVTTCYNTGDVIGTATGEGTYCYVGGVVGDNQYAVSECFNEGSVRGTSEDSSCYVGGVVGGNSGQVTTCYNTGAVSGTSTFCYVGGVVGDNSGQITNCYNTGDVTGEGFSCSVGGVVGHNSGQVTTCYNTGAVRGTATHCSVGGVVGHNSGQVTTCYYLSGTAEKGVGNDDDNGTAEAMDEFFVASEGMAELLNDNQEDGPWKYINENSAPTLKAFNKG